MYEKCDIGVTGVGVVWSIFVMVFGNICKCSTNTVIISGSNMLDISRSVLGILSETVHIGGYIQSSFCILNIDFVCYRLFIYSSSPR